MSSPTLPQLENAVLLPHHRIRPNPQQPREFFDETELRNLRASIEQHGLLQPITVRYEPSRYDGTPYIIVAGERRWRAAEGVLEDIPALIQNVGDATARELSLVENLQRQDLTSIEEAKAVRDLMTREGLSERATAQRLGLSVGWVHNRLSLLKTSPDVQEVAAKTRGAMSSLLLIEGVKGNARLRRDLLQSVQKGAAHSEIKARIEAHQAAQSAEQTAATLTDASRAPDPQTQSRLTAVERGESGALSRGQRLTGPSKTEANSEALRAAQTMAAWIEGCDDKTYRQIAEICRRVVRGDLSR